MEPDAFMLLSLDELVCDVNLPSHFRAQMVECVGGAGHQLHRVNPNHETSKPRPGLTVTKDVSSPFLLV